MYSRQLYLARRQNPAWVADNIRRSRQWRLSKKNDINHIISEKIRHCRDADSKSNRPFHTDDYVTIEWVKDELTKSNNKCYICSKDLKLIGWKYKDNDQFSIDRYYNDMAHEKLNCAISCWQCNRNKGCSDYF